MDVVTFAFNAPVEYDRSRPLYIDAREPSRCLNALQFKHLVQTLIAGLKRQVEPGDAVLVHLGNSFVHSALFFSILGAGNVYMGVSPDSPPHELDNVLEAGQPKLILTTSATLQTVLDVASARSLSPNQICLFSEETILTFLHHPEALNHHESTTTTTPQPMTLTSLLTHGTSPWTALTASQARATPASMFCTSGTSGVPKAAILSHTNMITHHLSSHYPDPSTSTTSRLITIPIHHLYGAVWTHIFPIRYGEPVYLLPRFEIHAFLQAVHTHQITNTYLVPAMVHILNQCPFPNIQPSLASLRFCLISAAPIDVPALDCLQSRLVHPSAIVTQNWGMTETGLVFLSPATDTVHDKASIGRVRGEGVEVQLVDPQDSHTVLAGDDTAGEVWVRGPGIFMGYRNRPEENPKAEGGWFRTGDMMYRRHGLYYVFGRVKEIIKVRGYSVAPAEIEEVLAQHPEVQDVAVLGVQASDGSRTEVPRAFVVRAEKTPASSAQVTEAELYRFVAERLARYKALDGGVVFVSQIPRTATGKIQRAKLGQMNAQREKVAKILQARKVAVGIVP
ncbi:adenylate-forming enzyme AfeA [Aspergillus saccharolyticus JOP 1030-1]|uniref:Adenylate-forming enzyme AfeA n=1 Tax=Aspergillus saccharolyticus JOP 1030-1 TaxID=1450539 RepID=A0A318ZBQ6_9EURO|nr:adenylate-forming enzyme AfeA [Aspergillus saccharolyticus JOP 1030-1]PYH44901.1 adenylate-forming enzyme AfeA [Aspergillus saccharolyticus JOP 1030-1]